MKLRNKLVALLLLVGSGAFGQMEQFDYKLELKDVSQKWHKLVLPDGVFGKSSQQLNDIRIFGLSALGDTLEAPYLMRLEDEKISSNEVKFKTVNTAHNSSGYYFTFEISEQEPVNQIKLQFGQNNFDWRIDLEGSQDQSEWFSLTEDYRILSIKNELTDFQFTKLTFPSSKYRFYRLRINSKEQPKLKSASLVQWKVSEGKFKTHAVKKFDSRENKQAKQTEIDLDLNTAIRANQIRIFVSDSFDYYRTVTIKCLTDSFKTEKGWKYRYKSLASGTLHSIENKAFKFPGTTLQKLKVFIHNQDNQALSIDSIQVQGLQHELIARFTEEAQYYLTYGKKNAAKPQYDIARFADQIPKTLSSLSFGEEHRIVKETAPKTEPLFKNKTWLWLVMALVIGLLGWFSLKMIKKA